MSYNNDQINKLKEDLITKISKLGAEYTDQDIFRYTSSISILTSFKWIIEKVSHPYFDLS